MAFVNIECGTRIKNDRVVGHSVAHPRVVRQRISCGGSVEVVGEGELG